MCPEAGTLALNVIRVTCDGNADGAGDGPRTIRAQPPLHIGGIITSIARSLKITNLKL